MSNKEKQKNNFLRLVISKNLQTKKENLEKKIDQDYFNAKVSQQIQILKDYLNKI
jgi:hypothetical protein